MAQGQTASLSGTVTDVAGAIVPGARVIVGTSEAPSASTAAARQQAVTADRQGRYVFRNLPPGAYQVQATSPSLTTAQPTAITLAAGPYSLDLQLTIQPTVQQLTVTEDPHPALSVDTAANASATVLRGEDLQALSDNPDDLASDLAALAGPSAGPSGGSIFVDGFSNGEIPPKEAIREIRINQDPFSAEFDKLGYGRIEIFTKPGARLVRGTVDFNYANQFWNSRNPYSTEKAPLRLKEFEGGGSGPLTRNSSFTVDAQRNLVDNGSIVNAVTLDPQLLTPSPYSAVYTNVQRFTRVTPRVDYQLNPNNTLTVRYGVTHADIGGAGIGGFDLISRGIHTTYTAQTVQASETAVLGAAINETRFQFYRNANRMVARSDSPVIQVLGSFTGGASQLGRSADAQDSYELQNYTTLVSGAHTIRFGTRLRGYREDSVAPVNFNGTYTFGGGDAPVLDGNNRPIAGTSQAITSIERYRRTLLFGQLGFSPAEIRAAGGGATQFSLSTGQPQSIVSQFDASFFAGDNWRARPNLTLAYGLRYEAQTNLPDWRAFAPRVSLAWAPLKNARKMVVRAGFGTFYDRFALTNTLAAERFNGTVQQQYFLTAPDTFPNQPALSSLQQSAAGQVTNRLAKDLRAPYLLQTVISVERQLAPSATLALTYTNTRGLHILRSRDINAPLPQSGALPLGAPGPVFLIESSGVYNQNQFIANLTAKASANLSLFSFYVLNRARSDTDGVNTAPANPYDFRGEYGPAATDIRHRVTFGGSVNFRWGVRISPFVILQSGAPFNLTTGTDVYGTSLFNNRPALATDTSKPGLVRTSYGLLDPNPLPGTVTLPRNFGRGPAQYNVNLRVAKSIGFGPEKGGDGKGGDGKGGDGKGGGGSGVTAAQRQSIATGGGNLRGLLGEPGTPRRYNFIVSMSVRNLLNHNNPGPIIGNVTSPLFGRANQLAGLVNGEGFSENASNRRLELQLRLQF